MYTHLGLDAAAREWIDTTLAIDPDHVAGGLLEMVHAVYRRDRDAALALGEEIVGDAPEYAYAWTGAAGGAYMVRDFDEAAARARRSLGIAPENTIFYWHETRVLLGLSLAMSGGAREGRRILERASADVERRIDEGNEDPNLPWDLAAVHAVLGDREAALAWLRRAYDAGFRYYRFLELDPVFDEVREGDRFRALYERMRADAERMRERVQRGEEDGETDAAAGGLP